MSDNDWGQWSPEPIDTVSGDNPTAESSVTVDVLGDYELMKIFGYLTIRERLRASRLCRKWRDCVDKSCKSETLLDNKIAGMDSISTDVFCLLVAKCSNVRHIALNFIYESQNSDQTNGNIVAAIANNCTQLQSMDFSVLFDTFSYFEKEFIKNAHFFKTLKKIISRSITEDAINSIIDSPILETIDLYRNDKTQRPAFEHLGPRIAEIILEDSQVFDSSIIKSLSSGNGKNIKRLSIDIRDKDVLALVFQYLKKLEQLKICLYTPDCDINSFHHLKNLRSLEIETTDSSRFSAQEFVGLVRSLKENRILELIVKLSPMNNIAITDESLQEIRKNCVHIEKLVIRGANSLTGSGMYAIAQMKYIRVLDLKDCVNITDQIDIVITSCPLLRELNLHNCSYITNSTLDPFINKAKASPEEKFVLDVIDTNVSLETIKNDKPNNLTVFIDPDECRFDCQHGWGDDNDNFSGPEDMDVLADRYDIDFYDNEEEDDYDYYDDYDDEYGDGNFDFQ